MCGYPQWTITPVDEKITQKAEKKKKKVEENERSRGDDSDPLCKRVVWEDNTSDEEEKDQYSHATSHHSQEPAGPSEG